MAADGCSYKPAVPGGPAALWDSVGPNTSASRPRTNPVSRNTRRVSLLRFGSVTDCRAPLAGAAGLCEGRTSDMATSGSSSSSMPKLLNRRSETLRKGMASRLDRGLRPHA